MILKIISKYGLAAHLGFLAASPVAFAPFLDAGALGRLVLWLSLFAAVWMLFDPSLRMGEHSADARKRVAMELVCDPFLWFFILVMAFAVVRWLNSGIVLRYDAEQSVWLVQEAAAPALPASAGQAGFLPMVAVVGLGVFVLGVRHAIGMYARLFCGLSAVVCTGVGGLFAAGGYCLGYFPSLSKAAVAGITQSPFVGTAFGFFLVLSVVCGMEAERRKWPAARLPYVLAVSGNASGLVFFSPPIEMVVFLAVMLLLGTYSAVYCARVGTLGGFARAVVFTLLGLAVPVLLVLGLSSPEFQQAKLQGFDPELIFPVEYASLNETWARIAKGVWLEHPWCGTGVGAFGLHVPFLAAKADWALLPARPDHALSGYWTLLAERGIVGCSLLAIGLGLLIWFWIARLVEAIASLRGNDDAETLPFACPPVVWAAPFFIALAAAVLFFSHAFASISIVFAFVAPLALSAASFPRNVRPQVPVSDESDLNKEGK